MTPTLSVALTLIVAVPDSVLPAKGDVIVTVGAVVSADDPPVAATTALYALTRPHP